MHGTRIRLTLHPDQDGAKGLRAEYGERLVCVRYRYDTQKHKRYKTVELVIAEENWTPPRVPPAPGQVVAIRGSSLGGNDPSAGQKCGWAVGPSARRMEAPL